MAAKALALKEEGNLSGTPHPPRLSKTPLPPLLLANNPTYRLFQSANYSAAETLYTRALQKDPSNPKLLTNRAMARLKLAAHDATIDDCLASIALEPKNLKAYYVLAQAQLALNHPNEALQSALTAYHECLRLGSSSTSAVSSLVLQAKKDKWEVRERERLRRRSALLAELEDSLRTTAACELSRLDTHSLPVSPSDLSDERTAIETLLATKLTDLAAVFAASDPLHMTRREVPEYLIDSISFSVMHDPVVTKTGQSYERATIVEHLRRSGTDPLTREPLALEECRPNVALRQACEEFLGENGWAVDW